MWRSTLAQRLQSPGQEDSHPSFAVVTVDLRGHGGSIKQTAPNGATREIDAARINKQDIVGMLADMEAVRSFLVGKNDAGELNLNKLSLVGIGMGATVIPQQLALPRAADAFEEDGSLKDKAQQNLLKTVVEKLAIAAKRFHA